MDQKQGIMYKLRAIKIGWINEQMYHILLKRETNLTRFVQTIKVVIFIINVLASAAGQDVDYRWWTITTSIIVAFDAYINKIKDETAYGSKIELHRSMTDECIRFNEIIESKQHIEIIENMYSSLVERSSKLHIDPEVFDNWEGEFKRKGIKEMNAFEMTDGLSKELNNLSKDVNILSNDVNSNIPINSIPESLAYSPRTCNPLSTSTTIQTKNKKADFELQRMFNNLNNKQDE